MVSYTIGPDLLQAIKEPFLGVLRDGKVSARTEHNLTMIFMAICLEAPNELTKAEIDSVVDSMSGEELEGVLVSLTRCLSGEPAEKAEIWCGNVGPWLARHWPRAAVLNAEGTSRGMLNMLAECGDAFPGATAWSLNYLQPTHAGLYRLRESGLPITHPDTTLQILDKVIGEDGVPPQRPHSLRETLEMIGDATPDLRANVRFQGLFRLAAE